MVQTIIAFLVSLFASTVGAICGIGGGVIIKPVLDATGILSVSAISFLSGSTVLVMSIVSVTRTLKSKYIKFEGKRATLLAIGAAVGGIIGKILFQMIANKAPTQDVVGFIQAMILVFMTNGTLIYKLKEREITTYHIKNDALVVGIGLVLGLLSSFLGIGGGPINLIAFSFCFSMAIRESALCSLYVIMFSQITSLGKTVLTNNVPKVPMMILVLMVAGGILGGIIGSKINREIPEKKVKTLFIILMILIIGINVFNSFKFSIRMM